MRIRYGKIAVHPLAESTKSAARPPRKPKAPAKPQPFPDIYPIGIDGLEVDFWRGAMRLRKQGQVIVLNRLDVRALRHILNDKAKPQEEA